MSSPAEAARAIVNLINLRLTTPRAEEIETLLVVSMGAGRWRFREQPWTLPEV